MLLKDQKDGMDCPPRGRYPVKAITAEATQAKSSGAPMLKLTLEIVEPAQFTGSQIFDNILTQQGSRGAGFGRRKLKGLGINVDSEVEIPDEQIANELLGKQFWADVDQEQIMDESPTEPGKYDQPRWDLDPTDPNKRVPVNKLVVKNYYSHNVTAVQPTGAAAGAPATGHHTTVAASAAHVRAAPPATQTPPVAVQPWLQKPPTGGAATGKRK